MPHDGLRDREPPFTDDRLNASATCHRGGLRVREGVVGTMSALETTDSQKVLVVGRLATAKAFRSEGPRRVSMGTRAVQ